MSKSNNMNARIGQWMKSKRIEKGFTMQEVANRMKVTRTAVHYWESGKRTIYAVNLIEFCDAINIDAATAVHEITHASPVHEARA